MADVIRWVDTAEEAEVLDLLGAAGVSRGPPRRPVRPSARRNASAARSTPRSRPCSSRSPGSLTGTDRRPRSEPDRPVRLLGGHATRSTCARRPTTSAGSPRCSCRWSARWSTMPTTGWPGPSGRSTRRSWWCSTRRPTSPRSSDLDALAATAAGHGVQLVTVWHDLAQITARYGRRGHDGGQQPPGEALPVRHLRSVHARTTPAT